ncbi:MAG: hypothetical protein KGJ55_03260 [Gammaproteobacteria bacterium]|nr:hypothetical protein [Gammaproteobacteria bacterium]
MAARFASQSAALHGQAVERWAAAEFAAANADAAAAAQAFEQREYGAARDAYGKALAGLAALTARAKDESTKALAAGAAALNRGDGAAAAAAFSLALAISPNDLAARHGQARVQTLGAVMAKVEDGRAAERAGDLQAAAADYRAALTLDPDTASARQALIRVETTLVERGYRRAVAAGLTALERNDLDIAEQAFTRAGKLHPGTAAVRDGLARVRNARRDQRIAELRQQAAAAERAEDWDSAVARYRAVLALDSTLSFAQSGLARSQPRALLAQRLQFFIRHPQRLDTAAVYAAATATLGQARDVTGAGPVLRRQIDALAGALQVAATPLPVLLVSDGITQVAVYKVGALGRFQTRNIDLRPGHYVAVGTRPGYRDVRIEFDVTPGAAATGPIEVRCQERV